MSLSGYQLCGYFNLFQIVPGFVYPVFIREGIYYLSDGSIQYIEGFIPLKRTCYNQLQRFPVTVKKEYHIGDPQVYIYIEKNNRPWIGSGSKMYRRLIHYHPENKWLQKEVDEFLAGFESAAEVDEREKLRYYGTGRRKTAVARVYLARGTGKFTIKRKSGCEPKIAVWQEKVMRFPLELTGTQDQFDVLVRVSGGGFNGQAEAIRHGISRALLQVDGSYRPLLKRAGLLVRDPRMKERKKYGLKAARRSPQTSKR